MGLRSLLLGLSVIVAVTVACGDDDGTPVVGGTGGGGISGAGTGGGITGGGGIGGDSVGGVGGGLPVSEQELCARFGDAYCRGNAVCCTDEFGERAPYLTREDCLLVAEGACGETIARFRGVAGDGGNGGAGGTGGSPFLTGLQYEPARAGNLIASLERAIATCVAGAELIELTTLFSPLRADGETCQATVECLSPETTCRASATDPTPRCLGPSMEGDPCSRDRDCISPVHVCRPGLGGSGLRCLGPSGLGERCHAPFQGALGWECADGLVCRTPFNSENGGDCELPALEGGLCGLIGTITHPPCAATLFCRDALGREAFPDGGTCAVRPVLGEACEPGSWSHAPCSRDAVCALDDGGTAGVCVAQSPNFVTCDNDFECWLAVGGACVAGACDPDTAPIVVARSTETNGSRCWVNGDCISDWCRGRVCEPAVNGARCRDDRACANGSCFYGYCRLPTGPGDYCGPPS